jgi:pyruvate dehydrogenase E2 component (dihydrolipoamide acetyltransferase)
MAFDFKFPDVGEGIHEGKIVKWLVKEGDEVKADQAIAEVETDKAVVEIPAPAAGKVSKLYHKEGEVMKVGEVMVTFEGDAPAAAAATEQGVVGSLEATATGVMKAPTSGGAVFGGAPAGGVPGGSPFGGAAVFSSGAVFTSGQAQGAQPAQQQPQPVPQQQAAQPGAAPMQQPATQTQPGPVAQPATSQPSAAGGGSMAGVIKSGIKAVKKYDLFGYIDRAPYDGVRKAVGDHMVKSVQSAPHVTHMDTADVTELWAKREAAKKEAEKQGIKLTFLAYILQALCEALKKHPFLNAMLDEENREIILRKYYNIGIAVDTEAGLMVPVLKAADRKELFAIAKEIVDLAEKARTRKINPMDFKGGTFTVTNVGSAGSGKYFTPVINFPEAAILGIGMIEDTPVARGGKVEVRKMMYLSLTYDHRILDGAEAARFMKTLKDLLEGTGAETVKPAGGEKVPAEKPAKKEKAEPKKRLIAKKKLVN